jgi:succinate semialdehyde dehydrogenase (EC 1.2.1.16)
MRAGMPPGVLNMLTSDAEGSVEIGGVLCASPVVRHLSFTGSTEVGRILMAQSAPTIKKLGLELGGNAPFIVFDDADVDAAVEGAMQSKYRNAGQTCVCANRLYVQDGVYDAFVAKLAAQVAAMKVGSGFETGVQVGPLIDEQALAKVQRHVDDAVAKGAKVLTGGKTLDAGSGGRFYAPTVLAEANAGMLCAREETFGPVAPVFRFKTEDDAIAAANATEFGLAAYFSAATWAAFFAWARRWNTAWSASTPGSCRTRWRPSAASSNRAWDARARTTALTNMSRLNRTCALGDIQR